MANLARVSCTECPAVYRLAAAHVHRAAGVLWCPVCLAPAEASDVEILSDEQRARIRAAVAAVMADVLPTLNAPAESARQALKRRAAKQRAALKRASSPALSSP